MPTPARHRAYILSLLTAAVLVIQAGTGVFVSGLYRDGVWVSSVLRGQDAVALTVVVPVLLVSQVMARRGSIASLSAPHTTQCISRQTPAMLGRDQRRVVLAGRPPRRPFRRAAAAFLAER